VDPNTPNSVGDSPLHSLAARRSGDKSLRLDLLFTFLVESDVDVNLPNRSGNTPLHIVLSEVSG
jgi:ankyrin repeat protein